MRSGEGFETLVEQITVRLRAGDVVRMLMPGGGGWGCADCLTYPGRLAVA